MATKRASSPAFAVIDSNVLVALCSHEPGRYEVARRILSRYATDGTDLYAPGVIVPEGLFVLCGKLGDGALTSKEHAEAVDGFRRRMKSVLPPPNGDASLIDRAEAIRSGYGCSRSADGIYIALAEELSRIGDTELLTFDTNLEKQATRNAPSVRVRAL